MSMFLPEGSTQPVNGVSQITPSSPETTADDIALMQRVLAAASRNPNLIPADFMSYVLDYIQSSRLQVSIGQVFGYQRVAPQVISDFASVPNPVNGQIVLLKVGSSSPFNYVQMMYDSTIPAWVSEEFSAGGGTWSTTQTSALPVGGAAGISWTPVHKAGLTMQLKWSGYNECDTSTPHAGIYLVFGNLTVGFTTATMSDATVTGDGANHATGVDWTTVTDAGDYNMVAIGMYARTGGSGTTNGEAAIVGRFIK